MNLRQELELRLTKALAAAGAPAGSPAMVAPAARPEFGDYQANGVMAAAKKIKAKPRDLAEKVVAQTAAGAPGDLTELAEAPEVAGPGFLNIRLKHDWLARGLADMLGDPNRISPRLGTPPAPDRLGVDPPAPPQTVVVDYSAPNLAKEMHVGHLRSTVIGDALARTLDFIGHKVIRQNHVGDWGTQFGMLTAYMDKVREHVRTEDPTSALVDLAEFYRRSVPRRLERWPSQLVDLEDLYRRKDPSIMDILSISALVDLEDLYRRAKELFDRDPDFARIARENVVKLQSGDANCLTRWLEYTFLSLLHCEKVYDRLGVLLTTKDVRGESAYNDDLPNVVTELQKAGLLKESQGAQCVFLPEFANKDGDIIPFIVQKSDEGYLYATTDLAAIRFRCGGGKAKGVVDWSADRILYVVDSRQGLHFRQLFAVARAAGFARPEVSLEHIGFGTMMGDDGKPFKTREGGTVKLLDLLDEAERRAYDMVVKKEQDLPADQRRNLPEKELRDIAHAVGIGAVKYADLSQNRNSDYVFSWDKMLSLEGNTAPYMQYAYARIFSIRRKGKERELLGNSADPGTIIVSNPAERALAVRLLQFPETVAAVAAECLPNVLCAYLYDLAGAFMGFYENCPVLQSAQPTRSSRLRLCDLTAQVIRKGLDLLGIQTVEQM